MECPMEMAETLPHWYPSFFDLWTAGELSWSFWRSHGESAKQGDGREDIKAGKSFDAFFPQTLA